MTHTLKLYTCILTHKHTRAHAHTHTQTFCKFTQLQSYAFNVLLCMHTSGCGCMYAHTHTHTHTHTLHSKLCFVCVCVHGHCMCVWPEVGMHVPVCEIRDVSIQQSDAALWHTPLLNTDPCHGTTVCVVPECKMPHERPDP